MKPRWHQLAIFLQYLLLGIVLALVLWLPVQLITGAALTPWLIAGAILGILLALFWEKYNPFKLRRLF